ncbi:MAG TPA: hypothetical protein PK771_01980 [Spirochaetota bacterium]|nr:hypothetical protein [Spirochaetota bacterium]
MIDIIKAYIKTILKECSNIPDNKIFLSAKEESQYKYAPWISILTKDATLEKKYSNYATDEASNLIIQNYLIEQPFNVAICTQTEKETSSIVEKFLSKLKRKYVFQLEDDEVKPVEIIAKNISYSDNISVTNAYTFAVIEVVFKYGVFSIEESVIINNINLNNVNYGG